ncbi:TraM recognition domain-containing protein [bacterium]|nr:TraM recognition domain-containing protein [bacterium]
MKWSEEFYRKTSSHALSDALILLCEIRDKYKKPFFLEELQKAVGEWNFLEYLLSEYEVSSNAKDIIKKRIDLLKTKEGSKQVQGISTDLLNITRSKAGSLLKARGDKIDIFESIQNGEIVYFLMDSMSDKESSELLGRLLLQDLIGATGMIYSSVKETARKHTQVIIDEFASFASENFIDFINRARGAGLGVMVAHQSRGDLKSVHETFCDRVERNCATKLIFGTDNSEDAEYFASMVGTRQALKDTMQMQDGWLSTESTGMMSRREVEEFVIHPNQIKNLSQGELLRISRIIDPGVNLTRIYKAEEFSDVSVSFDKIESTEEKIIEKPSKATELVKPDEVFL